MSTLKVNARFKSLGIPAVGLSPTTTVFNRSRNTTVVTNAPMTELSDGFYEFVLDQFDINEDFLFSFDGTATLADTDRYLEAEWSGIRDFIATIPRAIGGQFDVSKLIKSSKKEFDELREALEDLIGAIEIDIDLEDVKKAISESSEVNEENQRLHEEAIASIRSIADESIKKSEERLADKIESMKLELSTEKSDMKLEEISMKLEEKGIKMEEMNKDLMNKFGDFLTSQDFIKAQMDASGSMESQTKEIKKLLGRFSDSIIDELKE